MLVYVPQAVANELSNLFETLNRPVFFPAIRSQTHLDSQSFDPDDTSFYLAQIGHTIHCVVPLLRKAGVQSDAASLFP